jgi:hypothetical protein
MQHYRDIEPTFDFGYIRVLRASDDSPLGADVASKIDSGANPSFDWDNFSAALPPEAVGEVIKLEFQFTSDDVGDFYTGWYLDNIAVTLE